MADIKAMARNDIEAVFDGLTEYKLNIFGSYITPIRSNSPPFNWECRFLFDGIEIEPYYELKHFNDKETERNTVNKLYSLLYEEATDAIVKRLYMLLVRKYYYSNSNQMSYKDRRAFAGNMSLYCECCIRPNKTVYIPGFHSRNIWYRPGPGFCCKMCGTCVRDISIRGMRRKGFLGMEFKNSNERKLYITNVLIQEHLAQLEVEKLKWKQVSDGLTGNRRKHAILYWYSYYAENGGH